MPKRLTSDGYTQMGITSAEFHHRKYIRATMLGPTEKSGSEVLFREFDSVEHKYQQLMSECHDGELRGGPVHEMLRLGGTKHLVWVDIDTWDWVAFNEWAVSDACPWPNDSYRAIPSSTGKIHIYVVVDRELEELQTYQLRDHLRSLMPEGLAKSVDRVYGPLVPLPVYIPFAHTGSPQMPQDVVRGCSSVWSPSKDVVGETVMEIVRRRKRDARRP